MRPLFVPTLAATLLMVGCALIPHSENVLDKVNDKVTGKPNSKVSESELAVPIYPGSVESNDPIRVNNASASGVGSMRTTADTADQVIAFYKPKLSEATEMPSPNGDTTSKSIMGKGAKGEIIMIFAGLDDSKTKTFILVTTIATKG